MMLPVVNPNVIFKALPDGAVLFDPAAEVYYGLNQVGSRVWQLLATAGSLDEVCRALSAEYPDVPRETIRADVRELLDDLVAQGLASNTTGLARDGTAG